MKTNTFGMSKGLTLGMFLAIAVACLLMGTMAVQAQTATQGDSAWHYNLLIYGWGAGMSGDVGPSIHTYEAHISASELLSNLQFAGMLHFEATHDRWGILVDPLYVSLGRTVDTKRGDWPIDLQLKSTIIGLAGSYQIYKGHESTLDFTFGGRYMDITANIEPRYFETRSKGLSWVDPVIGLRGAVRMSKAWSFTYRGDIGGFGVGSDLTWSAAVNFNAQVSKAVSINFGYIALYDNYTTGSGLKEFTYDMTMAGPFIGVGFKW